MRRKAMTGAPRLEGLARGIKAIPGFRPSPRELSSPGPPQPRKRKEHDLGNDRRKARNPSEDSLYPVPVTAQVRLNPRVRGKSGSPKTYLNMHPGPASDSSADRNEVTGRREKGLSP